MIVGDFTDNGSVSAGDFASSQNGSTKIEVQISGVEIVDTDYRKKGHIGLMISQQDYVIIKDLHLKEVEILKSI